MAAHNIIAYWGDFVPKRELGQGVLPRGSLPKPRSRPGPHAPSDGLMACAATDHDAEPRRVVSRGRWQSGARPRVGRPRCG